MLRVLQMTSVRKEAGGRHGDGRRGSERTAAASRPALGLVRGLGSGEEQEGQDSRVTTPAAEGPHRAAEQALRLKPRTGGRLLWRQKRRVGHGVRPSLRKDQKHPRQPRDLKAARTNPGQVPRAPSCRHQRPASGPRSPCSSVYKRGGGDTVSGARELRQEKPPRPGSASSGEQNHG